MRKTVAALSASLLGVSGAAVAAAAPADAAPLPACTNIDQHTVSANANTQSWYMDCIPQFGLGKAEFTITSSTPYPAGYSLTDGHQTITSSINSAAAATYLGDSASSVDGALAFVEENSGSTPTSQSYGGFPPNTQAIFPITGVTSIDPADLPAGTTGCFPNVATPETYAHAYEVTFSTVTTVFKETIGGEVLTTVITANPQPLILGLNFVASPGTGLDPTLAQCASSGGTTLVADNNSSGAWDNVTENEATLNSSVFEESTLDPSGDGTSIDLGTFATTSTPVLATTGVDPRPAGTLGAGLLSLGILATIIGVFRRRRRSLLDPR